MKLIQPDSKVNSRLIKTNFKLILYSFIVLAMSGVISIFTIKLLFMCMNKNSNIAISDKILLLYKLRSDIKEEAERCDYKKFVDAEVI